MLGPPVQASASPLPTCTTDSCTMLEGALIQRQVALAIEMIFMPSIVD